MGDGIVVVFIAGVALFVFCFALFALAGSVVRIFLPIHCTIHDGPTLSDGKGHVAQIRKSVCMDIRYSTVEYSVFVRRATALNTDQDLVLRYNSDSADGPESVEPGKPEIAWSQRSLSIRVHADGGFVSTVRSTIKGVRINYKPM